MKEPIHTSRSAAAMIAADRPGQAPHSAAPDRRPACDAAPPTDARCPLCAETMRLWAAFYRCPNCGYKESCCF